MTPILGLVQHGSGPRYTSLVAENFVTLFAQQAAETARRYPHVMDWTPINEPLTTVRVSALYGFRYPHANDEHVFPHAFAASPRTGMVRFAARRPNVSPAAQVRQ